jgi:hypothetical protein
MVAACGSTAPVATGPAGSAPAAAAPAGQLVQTTSFDAGGEHLRVDGDDIALDQAPLADLLGLPMTGRGAVHVDLRIPIVDGHRDLRGTDGDISLACPTGCALGNDRAHLMAGGGAFAAGGIEFGHVAFDKVAIAVHVAHGLAQITQWQVVSRDVDLDVAGKMQLGPDVDDSALSVCVRFRPTEALMKAQPKTYAVVETTGAPLGGDGRFSIYVTGRARDAKRMARSCDGSEPIAAVAVEPPVTERPTLPTDPLDSRSGVGVGSGSDVALDLSGIKKVDDHTYELPRALVDQILSNPTALATGVRIVPAVKDGKPNGFKLYAIRPDSLWAKLGLLNGDTVTAINGYDLTSADKALEVYTKVREATSLQVDLVRRGQSMTITYRVR